MASKISSIKRTIKILAIGAMIPIVGYGVYQLSDQEKLNKLPTRRIKMGIEQLKNKRLKPKSKFIENQNNDEIIDDVAKDVNDDTVKEDK